MEISEINKFIRKIELFEDLTDAEREEVASRVEVQQYESGRIIFEENTPRKRLWMIYDGEVELVKKSPVGEDKRLAFFGKYDFLGEGALMDEYPHSTSARALLKTTLLTVSRDRFEQLCQQRP